jgi:hypothetical protein
MKGDVSLHFEINHKLFHIAGRKILRRGQNVTKLPYFASTERERERQRERERDRETERESNRYRQFCNLYRALL